MGNAVAALALPRAAAPLAVHLLARAAHAPVVGRARRVRRAGAEASARCAVAREGETARLCGAARQARAVAVTLAHVVLSVPVNARSATALRVAIPLGAGASLVDTMTAGVVVLIVVVGADEDASFRDLKSKISPSGPRK